MKAGETVQQTGLYRVSHAGHRPTHEAILWEGEFFPTCRTCGNGAGFEFLRPMPQADEFEHVGYDGDFLDSVLAAWDHDFPRLSA